LAIFGLLRVKSWKIVGELTVWCFITGIGVTAGMHRLWTHRSYKAKTPYRFLLMILASMSNQGTIYHWCRDHRMHHKFSDTDMDPHNISRGFFYSHIGWLLLKKDVALIKERKKIHTQDLLDDWVVKLNYDLNPIWNQFWCFVVPGLYGMWSLNSFYSGFLIYGVLRLVMVWHATWCVNSVAHKFGNRPYRDINPAESLITSIFAYGEGWHNWHHTYPYDYATSEGGILSQWNPTKMFIDFFWLIGQTYGHKRKVIRKKSS